MPLYTEHLRLVKPNEDEFYNIAYPNANMDAIDDAIQELRRENETLREELANRPTLEYANKDVYFSVSKSGDDNNPGSQEKPFLSIGRAVQKARACFGATRMYISIGPGLYTENLWIFGFASMVSLYSQNMDNKTVEIRGSGDQPTARILGGSLVYFNNLTLSHTGGHDVINYNSCQAGVENCIVTIMSGEHNGITVIRSNGLVTATQINGTRNAINANIGSTIHAVGLSGKSNQTALHSNASVIFSNGTLPEATREMVKSNNGQIFR